MCFSIPYWNIKSVLSFEMKKAKRNLSEFWLVQLVEAQPAEGSVQLEQLQTVPVQPSAQQEAREVGRQEEQGADVSLVNHNQTRREKMF